MFTSVGNDGQWCFGIQNVLFVQLVVFVVLVFSTEIDFVNIQKLNNGKISKLCKSSYFENFK